MTRVFRTVHGKLSLALLFLVGVCYAGLTIYTKRMYIREVNQHLNRASTSEFQSRNFRVRSRKV